MNVLELGQIVRMKSTIRIQIRTSVLLSQYWKVAVSDTWLVFVKWLIQWWTRIISQQELCRGSMVLIQSLSEDPAIFLSLTMEMDRSSFLLISASPKGCRACHVHKGEDDQRGKRFSVWAAGRDRADEGPEAAPRSRSRAHRSSPAEPVSEALGAPPSDR